MASKKKVTDALDEHRGAAPNQQEVDPSQLSQVLVNQAAEWCKDAGEFNAEDLAAALELEPEEAVALTRRLHADEILEHGKIVPSEDPLHTRFQARLTSSPDSGEASTVEIENDKGRLYDEIALDQASGPPVAQGLMATFMALGERAKAQRAQLMADLQVELDRLHEKLESADGHLGSLEANRDFATALNSLLDELGLRIEDPKSGRPSLLRVIKPKHGPETGYFGFRSGGSSAGSYPKLPRLVLMERPEHSRRSRS